MPAHTVAVRAARVRLVGLQAVSTSATGPTGSTSISPNWQFLTDVRPEPCNFTWITPVCDDSDHVNCGGGNGPSWVAALVNAVGESKFWDSTAIFVLWDDWGGLTTTFRRRSRITTAWAFAFRCSYLALRARRATSRTCSTRRRACCASQRTFRTRATCGGGCARDLAGRRLLRLLAETAPVCEDQGAVSSEVLHRSATVKTSAGL